MRTVAGFLGLSVERWRMLEARGEYYRKKLAFLTGIGSSTRASELVQSAVSVDPPVCP
jgi:hypothetical protein